MIKFGTDGWRGVLGDDFTFQNVKLVAQAYAIFLKRKKQKNYRVLIGYDTRFLSPKFAQVFACVLAANEIKTSIFKKPLPTPSLCFAIKKYGFSGGIMITASHNPPEFNGIKIKTGYGSPALPRETREIEKLVKKIKIKYTDYNTALKKRLIRKVDYKEGYLNFLKGYLNFGILKNKKFKVLHDAMYGTGDHLLEEVLSNTNIKVKTIRSQLDPSFNGISPEPIPRNINLPLTLMRDKEYDICIITDGDSDRIGVITPGGRFLNPGWIMSLLLLHLVKNRGLNGTVVKTISNSSLINKIAAKYNLKLYETPVGFKHIAKLMQEEDILIGGEESGGIGFKGYIPERDGLLSGLLLLEMIAYENKKLLEIIRRVEKSFGKFYYQRIDLHYPEHLKSKLFDRLRRYPFRKILNFKVEEIKDYDGVKFILEDGSWLLFRLSGTEPILRIYSESNSWKKVRGFLKFGKNFALKLK